MRHCTGRLITLREQVALNIQTRRLFSARQRILIAVSGGVDSMVLLRVLHELSIESGWKLVIAHLNHQLRGTSSLADERLVRRTARDLKLPFVVERANVRTFAKERNVSIEMAARSLRHSFLARTAAHRNIPSIALAHHLDDQLELFFLRLLRGSGGQGLAGMKWMSPSPNNPEITLVRPLLDCSKDTLLKYAARCGINFREDGSNSCLDIQRNRIRHELLPLLRREYQPGLSKSVARVMDILAAESEFVTAATELWLQATGDQSAASENVQARSKKSVRALNLDRSLPALVRTPFEELPVALQRRSIQLQLLRDGITPDYDLVEHLRLHPLKPIDISEERIKSPENCQDHKSKADEPHQNRVFRLRRDNSHIVRSTPEQAVPFRTGLLELDVLPESGHVEWDGVKFAWQVQPIIGTKRPKNLPGIEVFDAQAVGHTVVVRHWHPGDRFQPIGMKKSSKLQDLFVNQKVPHALRRQLMVACTAQGDLFWVESLRVSERFKLTKSTIRRLHWAWQRL